MKYKNANLIEYQTYWYPKTEREVNMIEFQPLKKYYSSRKDKIEWIVVHYTGTVGADGRAQTISNSLHNIERRSDVPSTKKRSTHYIVGDDKTIQLVEDFKAAWHVGSYKQGYKLKCSNSNSIGVDLVEYKINKNSVKATDNDWYFSNNTINQAAKLISQLMKTYKIDIYHVVRHYDVTGKICPAPFVGEYKSKYTNNTKNFDWMIFLELIKIWYEGRAIECF